MTLRDLQQPRLDATDERQARHGRRSATSCGCGAAYSARRRSARRRHSSPVKGTVMAAHAGSRDVRARAVVVRRRGGRRRVRHVLDAVRERGDRPRRVARVPAACAAPTASARTRRRADAAGEDSAGHPRPRRSSTRWPSVAERYSRGFGHITTRQNIQLHFLKLHDVELAMRELADAGLTTREACGNSVRNITACPYAGVAADEAVRRHAVRRGADALPAASSAQLGAAAQVQDRLRGLHRTITSARRSTTSAGRRASRRSTAGPCAASASRSPAAPRR